MTNETVWNIANTWKQFCSPARPEPSELDILESHVKNNMNILLFGSTPEYRDLFCKHNCNVTLVDYSEYNYQAMTELMQCKSSNEIFINSDWLDMTIDSKFDLIAGDHIINLIPFDKWQDLLKKTNSLLNNDGLFIQRVITRDAKFNKNLEQIFTDTKSLNKQELFSQCFYDLFMLVLNQNEQTVKLHDIFQNIKLAYEQKLLTPEQFDFFANLKMDNNNLQGYIPTDDYMLQQVANVFAKNEIIKGDIYYKDRTYFIVSS